MGKNGERVLNYTKAGGSMGIKIENEEEYRLKFCIDMSNESVAAKIKHPSNKNLLPALMEEVGELSNALLELENNADPVYVYREAVQVATLAMRIALGEVPECGYKFEERFGNE